MGIQALIEERKEASGIPHKINALHVSQCDTGIAQDSSRTLKCHDSDANQNDCGKEVRP